ncbi:hypothetical protein [Sorangium cellulosum]|uniref:Secreted protein n=1 Tax=Sorangium cellulosum TaxID=56 RepID=A0A150QI68_SORCE|nr:hypothetical protein [Sorangium cellulosum]KYF67695.1 hypothetical protein BE15_31305 [Sorangium cellulosum]
MSLRTLRVVSSLVLATWPAACVGESSSTASGGSGGTSSTSSGGPGGTSSASSGSAGGASSTSSSGTGGGASSASSGSAGGASAGGGGAGGGGAGGDPGPGACGVTRDRIRITEIDVGIPVINNEDEAALMPLVISPLPSRGARLAWMGDDDQVHVIQLDRDDQVAGPPIGLPANDFSDLHADDDGGVLLLTRDAEGGGTLNCGAPANLCGTPPSPPIPCHDMYMVRFDGASETWATKLTSSSAALPPYSTGPTGPNVTMIWWYAHHGRIAFDGARYAGYFGAALSVSQGGCINIHQGDRMKVVDAAGALRSDGFDWGCSHSGYERILWDERAGKFVTVCKTDNNNRIALAPSYTTIYPVDLAYSNLGNLVTAVGGGTWLTASNIRPGQPAGANGLADVRLLHFTGGAADQDLTIASDAGLNHRAPHLAAYGGSRMIAAWESTTAAGDIARNDPARALYVQTRDRATGEAEGEPLKVDVLGNRYQDLVAFPDGSAAFVAPGSTRTKIKVLRILPCA